MKQPDAFLQSLNQLDSGGGPIEIDVSGRVIQTIHDWTMQPLPSRATLPTAAVMACIVALTAGVLAFTAYASAADPISSLMSPMNVSLQW